MTKPKAKTEETEGRVAGLPGSPYREAAPGADPQGGTRSGSWFTLPKEVLPKSWVRPDSERRVLVTTLRVAEEDNAAKLAGAGLNVQATFRNKVIVSIRGIGPRMSPDLTYVEVTSWFEDIGPAGRSLLDDAFNRVNAASEAATEMFRQSEEPWVG